jgi:hypothetical protein
LAAGPIQRSVSVFAHTSHAQHPVFGISAFGSIVASVKQEKPAATTHFSPSHTSTSASTPAAGFAILGSSSIEYSKPSASSSSSSSSTTVAASQGLAQFSSLDELAVNRDVSTGLDRLSRSICPASSDSRISSKWRERERVLEYLDSLYVVLLLSVSDSSLQKILKDIVTPRLTNSQALFYFGVLAFVRPISDPGSPSSTGFRMSTESGFCSLSMVIPLRSRLGMPPRAEPRPLRVGRLLRS